MRKQLASRSNTFEQEDLDNVLNKATERQKEFKKDSEGSG